MYSVKPVFFFLPPPRPPLYFCVMHCSSGSGCLYKANVMRERESERERGDQIGVVHDPLPKSHPPILTPWCLPGDGGSFRDKPSVATAAWEI